MAVAGPHLSPAQVAEQIVRLVEDDSKNGVGGGTGKHGRIHRSADFGLGHEDGIDPVVFTVEFEHLPIRIELMCATIDRVLLDN